MIKSALTKKEREVGRPSVKVYEVHSRPTFVKIFPLLPLHMKDGFPDAMSSSVPFMRKGHRFSTIRQVDRHASTSTYLSESESNSHIGR